MLSKVISKQPALRRGFSFVSNLHHPPVFYVNGQKYINDYDIEEYRPQL